MNFRNKAFPKEMIKIVNDELSCYKSLVVNESLNDCKTIKINLIIIYKILCSLIFACFFTAVVAQSLSDLKDAPIRPYKLVSIPKAGPDEQFGFIQYNWQNSKGKYCNEIVPHDSPKWTCYVGTFSLKAIIDSGYTESTIPLFRGTALHATDKKGISGYGIVYDTQVDTQKGVVTFYLAAPPAASKLDIKQIVKIDSQLNPFPQNSEVYNLQPIYTPGIPESGLFPSSFPIAYQNIENKYINFLQDPVDFSYDGTSPLPSPLGGATCKDFFTSRYLKCAKLHLWITDNKYSKNPAALLGRQIEVNVKGIPIFSPNIPYTGAIHFIPVAFEPDSSDGYYFHGLLDMSTYGTMDPPWPVIESIPDSFSVKLEDDYVSYVQHGRLQELIPGFESNLFPLSVAVAAVMPYPVTEPLEFDTYTFISNQDWFSHLGWFSSAFKMVDHPFNEVIELPLSRLGLYGSADGISLLNGRIFNITGHGKSANAIIYDTVTESKEVLTPGNADIYVKADKDISSFDGPLHFSLAQNLRYPQTDLFYYNPMGNFIPYSKKIDLGYSPIDPTVLQVDEENDSLNSPTRRGTWTSVWNADPQFAVKLPYSITNKCPIKIDNPLVAAPLGCTEVEISNADEIKKNIRLDYLLYDSSVKNLDGSKYRTTPGPMMLIELHYNPSINGYDSTQKYYYVYSYQQTKSNSLIMYVSGYTITRFANVQLLNEAIKQQGLPPSPYMYALVQSDSAYLVPEDDNRKLKHK